MVDAITDLRNTLAQNVMVVDFVKVNGDKRSMTCTLREDIKPKPTSTDTVSQKKVREISESVVSVWDVNANGWRSFRFDNVVETTIVKEYEIEWYNSNKKVDN